MRAIFELLANGSEGLLQGFDEQGLNKAELFLSSIAGPGYKIISFLLMIFDLVTISSGLVRYSPHKRNPVWIGALWGAPFTPILVALL